MRQEQSSPVKLWGPLVLSVLLALSFNSYAVSANGVETSQPATAITATQPEPAQTTDSAETSTEPTVSSAISQNSDQPETETTVEASSSSQPTTTAAPTEETNVANPQGLESNAIINVQPVWDENYKGQGTVVAVIDSGLDINHDVLRISDLSTAKYQNQAQMEAKMAEAGITYGKWYNDKVVFGYNYTDVNEELKENKADSHGMHVSGIAVGNPSTPAPNDSLVYGVAPEAQLMFMRVFSDKRGAGTFPLLYARAIEDAVKLGADSINLSLGGANGSLIDVGEHVDRAIAFARSKGVAVVIAAGNDTVFGDGKSLPYASNPDYGVVGTPSTARDSISVASYNNTHITQEVANIIGMEDNDAFNKGAVYFTKASNNRKAFPTDIAYDYVFVNLGKEEDYANVDVTGKIALVKRGEITFEAKIKNAKTAGAAGIVVFNNQPQTTNFVMSVSDGSLANTPSAFFPMEIGEELAKEAESGKYKIQFAQNYLTSDNPVAGQMSDFTSWGVTVDGELKPDVTAPGGAIYSAINDNKYNVQDGTSMAAPHVAGVVALMKQALVSKFPDLSPADLQTLIKQLLMSTAVPHFNTETAAYTSPRQQGAGIVDAHGAIHSDFFVTGDNDLSNLALGNVDDKFTLTVRLHNLSDKERTFDYVAHLNTDDVADGRFTLKPRSLNQVTGQVTVAAKSSTLVTVDMDASTFAEELSQLMVNGYFLEGFVRFLDQADQGHVVSIPFVGFRGAFQNLAVLEKPIYDHDFNNGELPFYLVRSEDAVNDQLNPESDNDYYTVLMTSTSEWDHLKGTRTPEKSAIIGAYKDKDGRHILYRDENGKPQLSISPNGDNHRDAVILAGTFLRNFEDLKITVYAADDTERTNPIFESKTFSGDKNFWSGNADNPRVTVFMEAIWEGKDKYNKPVADGLYKYVVSYKPQIPGAPAQETVFDILVDTAQPALTTGVIDRKARTFKPRPTLVYGKSPLYREVLYYNVAAEEVPEEDAEAAAGNTMRYYIEPDENGVYHLPTEDVNGNELGISSFFFAAETYSGMTISTNLSEYPESENYSGMVGIKLRNPLTDKFLDDIHSRYIIRDTAGNRITENPIDGPNGNLYSLPFGDYTVELFLIDEDSAYLIDERIKSFTLSEEKSLVPVTFDVTVLTRQAFTIDFDTVPPTGTKVYLVDRTGKKIELPQARYTKDIFERKLVTGDYTVTIELPEGYFATENNFTYTISADSTNRKELGLWAKGDLDNGGAADTSEDLPEFDLDADHDGDGFSTRDEMDAGTDPFHAGTFPETKKGDTTVNNGNLVSDDLPFFDVDLDHDGDGFTSRQELDANTNPLDKTSFPVKKEPVQDQDTGQPTSTPVATTLPTEPETKTDQPVVTDTNEPIDQPSPAVLRQAAASAPTSRSAILQPSLPTTGEASSLLAILGSLMSLISLFALAYQGQKD